MTRMRTTSFELLEIFSRSVAFLTCLNFLALYPCSYRASFLVVEDLRKRKWISGVYTRQRIWLGTVGFLQPFDLFVNYSLHASQSPIILATTTSSVRRHGAVDCLSYGLTSFCSFPRLRAVTTIVLGTQSQQKHKHMGSMRCVPVHVMHVAVVPSRSYFSSTSLISSSSPLLSNIISRTPTTTTVTPSFHGLECLA